LDEIYWDVIGTTFSVHRPVPAPAVFPNSFARARAPTVLILSVSAAVDRHKNQSFEMPFSIYFV
jgi:hypothetical protein